MQITQMLYDTWAFLLNFIPHHIIIYYIFAVVVDAQSSN